MLIILILRKDKILLAQNRQKSSSIVRIEHSEDFSNSKKQVNLKNEQRRHVHNGLDFKDS